MTSTTLHRPLRIAVFTKNRLNPGYHAARVGAECAAARLHAKVTHYVPDKPDNVGEQLALIDEAIAHKADAFVFTPVHGSAVDAAIRKVNAAGIPVFNIINRLRERSDYVTFVGADDHRLGMAVAERLYARLKGRGNVVILEGTPTAVSGEHRVQGFRDAASALPDIRILGSRTGNFLREDGARAMRAFVAEFPQIDGVLAANDSMALAAIDVLREAGRSAAVVGVNAIPEAIAAIKSGTLLASADFDTFKLAALATEAAVRHLRGERLPRDIIVPVEIVDRDNYHAWDRPVESRACPDWERLVPPVILG